jgi:Xaa-Pro aminopeptidase
MIRDLPTFHKMATVFLVCFFSINLLSQEIPLFQTDFTKEEFVQRRQHIFDAIGNQSLALIQGGSSVTGFEVFRQTNEFYYLCGLEIPQAYLLLDGRNQRTTLYLPHRDDDRERGEGKTLSVEDAESIKTKTGIDRVEGTEMLSVHLSLMLIRAPFPKIVTPHSPAEGRSTSRDELLKGAARAASDPWERVISKEARFVNLIHERFPGFEVDDLSPILDEMRLIKSAAETDLIRRASQLAGLGLMEAMRSTQPGLMEYQLGAVARYIFLINGARDEAYNAIIGSGTHAWYGHYFHNRGTLNSGDMVLMDYAPSYHYYTSDVTRIWPNNGKFTQGQKELYGVIVAWHKELIKRIRPGITPNQIMDEASEALKPIIAKSSFSKPIYRKAAEGALTFRGGLSHPVGMSVHDVGNYYKDVLKPGMVFSVDPMIWVEEEKLYVRVEDVGVVTETGFENFSAFVPTEIEDIEKLMKEEGVLQIVPPDAGLKK